MTQNPKWGDYVNPILAISLILDTLMDETKDVWIMEPIPQETEALAQSDKQQDT